MARISYTKKGGNAIEGICGFQSTIYEPTQEEIEAKCAEFQSKWSEHTRRERWCYAHAIPWDVKSYNVPEAS